MSWRPGDPVIRQEDDDTISQPMFEIKPQDPTRSNQRWKYRAAALTDDKVEFWVRNGYWPTKGTPKVAP